MKEIESIKQNHPELYSPINEWHALDPYYKWRSDGKSRIKVGRVFIILLMSIILRR